MISSIPNQMNTETSSRRGGRREGAGRKSQGKAKYSLSLTQETVVKVQERTENLSGLVDDLLAGWLRKNKAAP
jgi:hypothetical protein